MAERKLKEAADAARELVITRVVDAPRERVWDAWTDPLQVVRWWGPVGFSTSIDRMEVRPGGVWHHTMKGPDGAEYPNKSTFVEVVKPERIVYTHGGGKDGVKGVSFLSTWTFETVKEQGRDKTRITIRMVFDTAEERNRVVREFGAEEGGNQTLARLGDYVAGTLKAPDLALSRTLDAPRDLVFKVWTDPAHMRHWWGPSGFTTARCEADVRLGGAIRIDMRGPDGTIYPMQGTFTEIAPPQRLAFTSSALDERGQPKFEVLTTITFAERHGKTVVMMEARVTMQTPAAAPHLAGMEAGWNQTLDRMADYACAHAPEAFVISRVFDAPRALVFRVWTDEKHLAQWFGPKGVSLKAAKLDLKPGGIFHYGMTLPNGQEIWGKWTFLNISAPESMTLITSFSDAAGGITVHPLVKDWPREMLSLMTFDEEPGGKTRVTIRWAPYAGSTDLERKVFADGKSSMQQGWGGTLDVLAEYLAKQ